MEIACKQAAIFTEHIMFHAVYADGLSLMFALVANVEHGFIAADLDVLHRQLPTLILPSEILQHVPAFLDWSSGRVLHFEDRKSTRYTPVTNAHLVCRLQLEKKTTIITVPNTPI